MNGCVIHLRGYQLRIDAFYEKHNLALEFHGSQYYIFSKRFHDTQENFIREKELDQVKETLVLDNNIHYIAIPYNYSLIKVQEVLTEFITHSLDFSKDRTISSP